MAASDKDSRSFPEDLYGNILLRLPVKSLLRFKCVCKIWYTLIKNPNFIKEHLNNCSNNKSPQLLIYDYGAADGSPPVTLISDHGVVVPLNENLNYFQRFRGMTDIIGAVDGLFLLKKHSRVISDDKYSLVALWNPATREVRILPEPEIPFAAYRDYFGFGLDPSTNDYKVISFSFEGHTAVYSCSRDSWRIFTSKISEFGNGRCKGCGTTYLNGSYFWSLNGGLKCIILLFDFSKEVFEAIDGPDDDSVTWGFPLLLDNFISLMTIHEDAIHDIWVMIRPGVWNKLFTFQCFPSVKSWYSSTAILVTRSSRLVSYNVRTQKTKHLRFRQPGLIEDAYDGYGVYPYKESLVTIKRESQEVDHCSSPDIFGFSIEP